MNKLAQPLPDVQVYKGHYQKDGYDIWFDYQGDKEGNIIWEQETSRTKIDRIQLRNQGT